MNAKGPETCTMRIDHEVLESLKCGRARGGLPRDCTSRRSSQAGREMNWPCRCDVIRPVPFNCLLCGGPGPADSWRDVCYAATAGAFSAS